MSTRRRVVVATGGTVAVLSGLMLAGWSGRLGLRSHTLLILLALGSAGAATAVVVAWRRLARPGSLPVIGRVAALLGCQLLTTLLLLAAVNDWGDFYSSWSDLLGAQAAPPVLHDPTLPPGGIDRAFAHAQPRPGRLKKIVVAGTGTGLSTTTLAWFPPQYFEKTYAHTRFPVALLLGGYPSHVGALTEAMQVPQVLDGLARSGHLLPMVMVMASPGVVMPRDTECTDIEQGPQVQTFFGVELPHWYAAHYRVMAPGSWGVLGVSTGGFCAAKLALTHPDVFAAAVSFSGYLTPLTDSTTGDLFGGDPRRRDLNDPTWRITHLPPPHVALLLSASRQEGQIYQEVEHFAGLARPPLRVATLIRATGGHNDGVWLSEEPVAFEWLSARLLARMGSWPPVGRPVWSHHEPRDRMTAVVS